MADFAWAPNEPLALNVGGARLEAQCHGPPPHAAPTIVLLHEGLGCVALWREFPAALAAASGFGVFAWSRAGYGGSDPIEPPRPLDYMTREALLTLPLILDAIGLRSGVLVGHSDGASIAAIYAGSRADARVRGLVLIAPHFFTEPSGLAAIEAARAAYETGEMRARLAKYHRDVDGAFRGWNGAWLDPRFESWNIADSLDGVTAPILAIQGTDDPYGTLRQIEEITRRCRAPVEVEILEGAKHAPHLEAPERALAAIVGFCARLDSSELAGRQSA